MYTSPAVKILFNAITVQRTYINVGTISFSFLYRGILLDLPLMILQDGLVSALGVMEDVFV